MRPARGMRHGVTLLESAVIGSVFFLLVLGMLDLGIAVYRQHLLSDLAREGARQAIVHGAYADATGAWGPTPVGPLTADQETPLTQALRPGLTAIEPATVVVQAEWLDGTNEPGSQVRVTVTTTYEPLLTTLFTNWSLPLEGRATMTIAH